MESNQNNNNNSEKKINDEKNEISNTPNTPKTQKIVISYDEMIAEREKYYINSSELEYRSYYKYM